MNNLEIKKNALPRKRSKNSTYLKRRNVSDETKREVLRMLAKGHIIADINKACGTTNDAIYYLIKTDAKFAQDWRDIIHALGIRVDECLEGLATGTLYRTTEVREFEEDSVRPLSWIPDGNGGFVKGYDPTGKCEPVWIFKSRKQIAAQVDAIKLWKELVEGITPTPEVEVSVELKQDFFSRLQTYRTGGHPPETLLADYSDSEPI